MITNSKPYILTIVIFIAIFGVFNYNVFNADGFVPVEKLSSEAVKGQQLFQSNRCWSCPRFYGLGGYLEPDITNGNSDQGIIFGIAIFISPLSGSPIQSIPSKN